METNKVYAKVENNTVIDYPVYENMIRVRGHKISDYYEVWEDKKPIVDFYHTLQSYFEFKKGYRVAFLRYRVVEKSQKQLETDLNNLKKQYKLNLKHQLKQLIGEEPVVKQEELEPNPVPVQRKYLDSYESPSLGIVVNIGHKHISNVEFLINSLPEDLSEIEFRLYDNTYQTLTKLQLKQLKKEMEEYILQVYRNKAMIEKQIDEASTYEELLAIQTSIV